jgi:hypothetical protein
VIGRTVVDVLSVAFLAAVSLRLSVFVLWLVRYRDGGPRLFMLCLVGAACVWAWFSVVRAIADHTYSNDLWNTANLVVILLAWAAVEYGFRRLVRR